MNFTTKLVASAVGVTLVAVAVAVAGWYFLFNSDAPAPVSLESAAEAAGMAPGAGEAPAQLEGDWTLAGEESSFAGYRVDQQLAGGLSTETVVGRTQDVEGSLSFDGSAITSAEVLVDMTTLESDESLRDSVLRGQAIETGEFPSASFVLTSPIAVAAVPADGEAVTQTVAGDLTLHGVTLPVQVDMEATLQGGRLVVVGSHEVQFEDFGITPPSGPASVLSVDDHGIIEMQLVFEKAA